MRVGKRKVGVQAFQRIEMVKKKAKETELARKRKQKQRTKEAQKTKHGIKRQNDEKKWSNQL